MSSVGGVVGTLGASPPLQRLVALVARLLSSEASPVTVQVSLLTDEQSIAASTGPGAPAVGTRSPLADSLCSVTVALRAPLVVADAAADSRVSDLPPVTSGAVRAYHGVPLAGRGGAQIGALCAYVGAPRSWSEEELAVLEELGAAVEAQLALDAVTGEFSTTRIRWETALDAAGIGSFDWDLRTDRLDWDERMQELFGFAPGEFEPHISSGFERLHDEDRPAVESAIASAVAACGDYRAEFRVDMPDARERWVAARGRAIAGPGGQAARLIGSAYDITEMRNVRDEAARLLETMATGFAAVDNEWRVRYLNSEGARVVGISAESLRGEVLWDHFPGLAESPFGERYRYAMQTGETVQFEAYYPHLDGWFEVRAVPDDTGLGLYFLDVTERHREQERAEAVSRRLSLLASVSAELAAAGMDIEGAVAKLAQTVVPLLADWCVVSLVDEDGSLRDVGHWHEDPERRSTLDVLVAERNLARILPGAVPQAQRTGRTVVVTTGMTAKALPELGSQHARDALTLLAPESAVVVPLSARGKVIGVLATARGADRPAMTDDEVATIEEIALRAGVALDGARLYAHQQRLAEGLQRSLLTTPPEPDHCEIAVRYVPAAEAASVGGDWFDSFLQPGGATVLVIGDVMGHDLVAAAAMGQLRSLLRGIAWHSGDAPAGVLAGLDAAMEGLQVDTTATAVVARLEQTDEEKERGVTRLRWSNAGHPPPMVIQPEGAVLPLLGVEVDLLLGIDPHSPRTESVVSLDRGSTVLLYTDGLVERRGQDLEAGLAELARVLREIAELPLSELCDELLRRMLPSAVEDDVALVAVRLHRQDRPRPVEAGPQRLPPHVPGSTVPEGAHPDEQV